MSGFPGGIANGPSQSEHMEKDARVWERPWTLEEMRQSSASWSLAADSGLFLFLQDFSHKMLSKTHEIEKQLDGLIRDTKATDSCLHSVFSDFLMLSNTQFIENRVCDEEVEEPLPKTDAVEKQPERTREQKEAELIPKMQEAVNYGLRVLESAFEHLDIKAGNSDSEDEEVTGRVEAILEPKDLYVDRPLPYLIGSQAFMEQEDVGLGDLSSDEMSVDSDRDIVTESDDDKEDTHSDEDFIHEEGQVHNIFKKKSSMLSFEDDDEEEEDRDSDIFGESDKDEDHDSKNSGPISFADELAARIRGEPVHKQEGDRASLSSKKKSKSRKEAKPSKSQAEDDSDDMFKPPKMDEIDDDDDDDFSPFGGSSRLFSGGKGLFDDDDEGDLFADAPKPFVPEEKKPVNESVKVAAKTAEPGKSGKKIPAGGVSIFPANSLFGPGGDSDSVRSKENGTPNSKVSAPSKSVLPPTTAGGGGLFDEEEEDDDFFGGKSLQKSESVVKEKPKPKTTVDLFDEDDEDDGNIFSDKKSTTPVQVKKEVVAEPVKPPEKKMPAGAISMFGPGTKTLLSEALKKRRQSTSEESEKSEENGPAPDVRKVAPKPSPKPQTRGLFSDDEDAQVFPTIPRSQSKPEPTNQSNTNKAPVSLFDDDEEEDLFASAVKSKPKANSSKTSPMQTSSAVSSSLFSDDEDQWLGSTTTSDTKSGGMKASVSAPSGLTSTKTTASSSLFEEEDDNDLFAQTKETSQKKPQQVALLFEDDGGDNDEDKGTLFGTKTNVNTNTALPTTKTLDASSESSSSQIPKSDALEPLPTENKSLQQEKFSPQTSKSPETPVEECGESKKKPAGAVSLFGGINVLEKQTKAPVKDKEEEEDDDDDFPLKPSPPPFVMDEKEEKVKSGAFGLFDDDDDDDDEWNNSIFTPGKPTSKTTPKEEEEEKEQEEEEEKEEEVEPPQTKSTSVLQDEELFSHERDNDFPASLFATSGKAESPPKAAAHNLFSEDDEDDLFSSPKPKVAPKVAEKPSKPAVKAPLASPEPVSETDKPAPGPVKPKDSSSRIGKLQASLKINPAAMLPGAVPTLPGAISVIPGTDPCSSSGVSSSSLSPSPVTTPVGPQTDSEGVNFDTPVQVTTLQSVQKSRTKGAGQRRPQSRAARQKAVERSVEDGDSFTSSAASGPNPSLSESASHLPDRSSQTSSSSTLSTSSTPTVLAAPTPTQPTVLKGSPRPSVLSLPESNDAEKKVSRKPSGKVLAFPDVDDIFASDVLFEATPVTNTPPTVQSTTKTQPVGSAAKKDKDKNAFQSIFDDDVDDLFHPAKPRSTAKKAKQSTFLEDDDDDEDIFGVSNSSTPSSTSSKEIKNGSSFPKQEIFQDELTAVPKAQKKHKEKPLDFSLFDDDTDIFADLTDTFKPKQKLKTKPEAKSIFDDDMDDIFSSSKVKTVSKASHKSKKTAPAQETTAAADSSNIFDDPLNALGGT